MLAKTTLLSLFVVLLVVAPTLQLGVLWVNQITGNYDTGTVVVEEVVFDDNTMSVDFIRGLGNNGVNVEDTILKAGSVTIPVNLDVGQVATITGLLNANGGIIADAGDDAGFSFKVEDDTGITTINGELRPNGGINVDNGVFTVEDETGETRVANALLRPDGGINVNNGLFTVDADTGDVFTAGTLYVEEDIFIGTSEPADRFIKRIDSDFDFGGNTIIAAQSSTTVGGDLVLEPGYGTTVGRILLGRAQNDEIRLGRVGIQGTASFGGITRFQGQSSDTGRGGDLFVRAGNGGSGFDGGDLYLAPGASSGNSGSGVIYLGSDDCLSTDLCNSDIEVRRPTSTVSSGGATILSGQDSTTGRGGDYIIRAGNSEFNDGGDLYLVPGAGNQDVTYGTIFIGRDSNDELRIRRPSSPDPAGPLFLQGQDSANGNGGDIHIEAGDAGVSGINGGSIYLSTGNSGTAGVSGTIVLGNIEDELLVLRPDSGNSIAATKTTISGQNSLVSNGGDFVLSSGNGELNGGLLQLLGGEGKLGGGDVLVRSGDGQTDGGDILIEAGFGANGGDVVITSGAGANAGDVVLSGGLGASVPGNVVVRNADAFIVDQADVNIQGGDLYIQRGPCPDGNRPADCTSNNYVRLSSDPSSFLSYFDANAQQFYTLLTRRQINVPLPPSQAQVAGLNPSDVVQRLANTLYSLVNALGQCGHGLIQVRARDGSAAYPGGCTFPGPIPDITGGIAIPAGLPDGEALEH